MEENSEGNANNALARELGITDYELDLLDYGGVKTNTSNDGGIIYNGYIEIRKDTSDKDILDKLDGDDNGEYVTVYISSSYFNDGPEPDDESPYIRDDNGEDM